MAMNANDERKGFKYLAESMQILKENKANFMKDVEVLVMGKSNPEIQNQIPVKCHQLGFLSEINEIVDAYNAADLFVLPSLQDNLPNVIMEALACGTPCVGFKTGGVPEMIDHKENGFIANFKDANDLANGIYWSLENENRYIELINSARNKVLEQYSEKVVANQYLTLYNQLLNK